MASRSSSVGLVAALGRMASRHTSGAARRFTVPGEQRLAHGEVLHIGARKGSANTARGALRFGEDLMARVAHAGASGPKLLRADPVFWNKETMARWEAAGWGHSIDVRQQKHIKAAIAAILERDWTVRTWSDGRRDRRRHACWSRFPPSSLAGTPAGGDEPVREASDPRRPLSRTRQSPRAIVVVASAQAFVWPGLIAKVIGPLIRDGRPDEHVGGGRVGRRALSDPRPRRGATSRGLLGEALDSVRLPIRGMEGPSVETRGRIWVWVLRRR